MKTIKVKTISLYDKKHTWGKPLFKLGKPKKVKKSDKKLSYNKAKKKYYLKPFGDADKDGYFNITDCKPLDPKKHGVYKKYKDKPVFFYDTKGYGVKPGEVTQGMIFEKLEKKLPSHFGHERGEGGQYSDMLTDSLVNIDKGDIPTVKKVVGVHELEKPDSVSHETVFATKHLKDYLEATHPDKMFTFDIHKPGEVSYVEKSGKRKTEKISKLLSKPMSSVETSVRTPLYVQKKVKKLKSIFPEIERMTGKKLTEEQKKDIEKRLITEEDISGISSSYSIKPHWSVEELPKHFGSRKDAILHITDDPAEVVMKSMYPGMHSCESIDNWDWHPRGAFSDIEQRNPVAFFYLTGKTPYSEDRPSYRIMLRRAHPVKTGGEIDKSQEFLGVEKGVYGGEQATERQMYRWLLQEFLKKKNLWRVPLKTRRPHIGYSDFVAQTPEKAVDYLVDEWTQKAEERGAYLDEYDDDLLQLVEDDDITKYAANIPSVYAEEYRKPSTSEKTPTYKESVRYLLSKPKDKAIPRSFFYNILKTPDVETLKSAIKRPEMKPEYYHPLAFHPSRDIKREVASYPKLQQITVKELIPSKDYDVSSKLFFNPALTYKQRKKVAKREDEELAYDPYDLTSSVEPRVAREAVRITDKIRPSQVSSIARNTTSLAAIKYIYEKYPEQIEYIIKNPNTPESIVSDCVSDIANSKISTDDKIKQIKYIIENSDNLTEPIIDKIYRMFGNNPKVAVNLFYDDRVPPDIKNKIGSRLFKKGYEELLEKFIVYPNRTNVETINMMIDKLPMTKLKRMMLSLTLGSYTSKQEKELLSKFVDKAKSNATFKKAFFDMLESNRSSSLEKNLLELTDSCSTALHRDVIRYLMKSTNKSTTDELIKRYS